jgi:hypothetical protein
MKSKMAMSLRVTICLLLASCKADLTDGGAFSGNSKNQVKGDISDATAVAPGSSSKKGMMQGTYLLRVSLKADPSGKNTLCKSKVDLMFDEEFIPEIKTGKLKCNLIGVINMPAIVPPPKVEMNPESDGKVFRVKGFGGIIYDKPRPLMLGPIVQDYSKFVGFTESKEYSAEQEDPKTGKINKGTGTISVKALRVGESLRPSYMPSTLYQETLSWVVTTKGFKGLNRGVSSFASDQVLFTVSSRPLAILKIAFKLKIKDLLSDAGGKDKGKSGKGGGIMASLDSSSPVMKMLMGLVGSKPIYIHLDALCFSRVSGSTTATCKPENSDREMPETAPEGLDTEESTD